MTRWRRKSAVAIASAAAVTVTMLSGGATAQAQDASALLQRSVTVDGQARNYWVFAPEDWAEYRLYDPKNTPVVVVLHADGSSAEEYAKRTAWVRLAEERNFVAVFPNAGDGTWDSGQDAAGKKDADYLVSVTEAARSEFKGNEISTYLVGEGSGAGLANAAAATRKGHFAGVGSLGGAADPALWTDEDAGHFATQMPVWQVNAGIVPSHAVLDQLDYWIDKNDATDVTIEESGFGLGHTQIFANPDSPLAQVRVTNVRDTSEFGNYDVAAALYDDMLFGTLRFANRNSTNGTLVPFRSSEDLRLEEVRGEFGGYDRRWYVHLPTQYSELTASGARLPVVLVFHGRNGSFRYVAQQTGWADVADDNGFIAVFVQADPPPGTPASSNIGFSASLAANNPDVQLALGALADVKARYSVDATRVFATGVSQGAAFTNRLAVQYPQIFAAIAPCYSGHLSASAYADTTVVRTDVPLPVWQCRGAEELDSEFPGSEPAARTFWRETVNKHTAPPKRVVDGRYTTDIYTSGLAEYRFTLVGDIGHFMAPDMAAKIWDEFFSKQVRVDRTRPETTLVTPSGNGPFRELAVQVKASDNFGLDRIVANVYQGSKLVKSTQTSVGGGTSGTHTATVKLPDGEYTLRYNASDLSGNVSVTRTTAFKIDATPPTVTVKTGPTETIGANGSYQRVSFKLHDLGKIDRVELNGVVKDLTDNPWSDLNKVVPGAFGATAGSNTLVVFDVAGNSTTLRFTLTTG